MSQFGSHDRMGRVSQARVVVPGTDPRRARRIIILVAVCTALQMTSYGMIFPLFARKIGDFGDSVAVLATSVMVYSVAAVIAAPFMGTLADRFGRRPLILGSFAVFATAFTGYYLAANSVVFIAVRGLAGALTVGLGPATMGLVADIAPDDERARWIGVIGAGPAGLSFAYQMARRGYPVTVYDNYDIAGVMLYYGIPRYRLPQDVLEAETRLVESRVQRSSAAWVPLLRRQA